MVREYHGQTSRFRDSTAISFIEYRKTTKFCYDLADLETRYESIMIWAYSVEAFISNSICKHIDIFYSELFVDNTWNRDNPFFCQQEDKLTKASVTVDRGRKSRTALRTNQIAESVTVSSLGKTVSEKQHIEALFYRHNNPTVIITEDKRTKLECSAIRRLNTREIVLY